MSRCCNDCRHWWPGGARRLRGRCELTGWKTKPGGTCARFGPIRQTKPKTSPNQPKTNPKPTPVCGTCWRFEPAPPGRHIGRCTAHDCPTAPHEHCNEHTTRPGAGAFVVRAVRTVQ